MHKGLTRLLSLTVWAVLAASLVVAAEDPQVAKDTARTSIPSASEAKESASSQEELENLKKQISDQQKQIEQLRLAMEEQKRLLERSLGSSKAEQASPHAPAETPSLGQVATTTPMVPSGDARPAQASDGIDLRPLAASATAQPGAARALNQGSQAEGEKPKPSLLTLRIGDTDFTLGGFMDFTAFFRTTNLGSGIGTSFGSAPFSNTTAGHLTESRFSAQNSRVSLKADSKVGDNKVTGYVEADFLGFQPVNGFVTSNSNSLRMRLYWVDVLRGKWEVFGGQTWSMLTPGRNGISAMPSDLFYSQNMDTNYQVGLTWSRVAEFRLIYHPTKAWALGLALANPEQFVTSAVTLPGGSCSSTSPGPFCSQLDIAGTGGSTATPNLHPDILGKITYDPMIGGKHMHAEVAGVLRSFKVFDPATNTSNTISGGGGSVNLNLEMVKNFHLILTSFYSDAGGRYIFGLGPDVIVKPDGTLSPVHSGSGILGFEYQANPKFMLYGYYGGAYYQRNTAIDPVTGKFLGFGYLGSSNSSNRAIQEPTIGFIQTFWKNPRYGALQWINQYSYLTRSPWSVATGAPKNAHLSMVYTNLRYVLP